MCGRSLAGAGRGPHHLAAPRGPARASYGRTGGPYAHALGSRAGRPMFGFVALAAMGAVFLISFAPETLWLLFLFGWLLLPALGAATATLMRGAASLPKRRRATAPGRTAASGERELLRALQEHGELSPARAAMESESLSVAEADRILRRLTEAGYLEVRVRGGGLFYALWEADSRPQEALGDTGPEGSGR